ncbi:unnamed protein product [Durusdinium trenchii]|uniref:Uncharacterized protein n=1 Tax=Durusdinium trenchii TaxID=1381693 RepID=A0ABP0I6E7_9DINO
MVAERPGLTWTAWALGGADAGRLLNGRVSYEKAAARGPHGENSESRAVTHHGRPRLHTQVLPLRASSEHRKTHSETGAKGAWKELIATGPMGPTAQASPRLSQASPSNETKRSTSASSRPQSPRYEGEPHHDGIAVWRETQSLREDLGLSEERNPSVRSVLRSLKGPPSSLASPRRQIPGSASIYSERIAASDSLAMPVMPPWMSTFGLSNSQVSASVASPAHNTFAEAALGRLAWLQAEKEALEGWLNTAGYLPKDDLRNSRSRINDSISQASEPVRQHLSDLPGLHVQKLGDRRPSSLGARRTSRRASLLDESGYQNLASERAAAQAKLREDLRAVVSERWSEPLSADRPEGGPHHSGLQVRNSAPPGGLRDLRQASVSYMRDGAETFHAQQPRLSRDSGFSAITAEPLVQVLQGSSQGGSPRNSATFQVHEALSSASRHSSPLANRHSQASAWGDPAGRRHTEAGWSRPAGEAFAWQTARHSSPPTSTVQASARHSSPRGQKIALGLEENLDGYGSRRTSSRSSPEGHSGGRQKAPSFSWPGTSASFVAEEASHRHKASVNSVYQPPRARAITEGGASAGSHRQRFLSVPDVRFGGGAAGLAHSNANAHSADHRLESSSRQSSPVRRTTLEVPADLQQESEGSDTSSSESPEEAARRQAQVEHDLQELAARLHVPAPKANTAHFHPSSSPRRHTDARRSSRDEGDEPPKPRRHLDGRASSARSTLSGPIDLLALATKTRSEAGRALGAVGAGEVECRIMNIIQSK